MRRFLLPAMVWAVACGLTALPCRGGDLGSEWLSLAASEDVVDLLLDDAQGLLPNECTASYCLDCAPYPDGTYQCQTVAYSASCSCRQRVMPNGESTCWERGQCMVTYPT
jgi:hypothetical protein